MDYCVLLVLCFTVLATSAWTVPHQPPPSPHRTPMRFARLAPYQVRHYRIPAPVDEASASPTEAQRPKRDFDDHSHDHYHRDRDHDRKGTTGPVHTFIKTDKNANYKWGVRHHVGNKFAS